MKKFVAKQPLLFAIGIVVINTLVELLAFITGGSIGISEGPLVIIVLLIATAIPIGVIWWLGWWRDAGFVTTTHHVPALVVPFLLIFPVLLFYGTVEIEARLIGFILVIFFLTALSEEVMSRGLLVRVFLPKGKWQAVLIPAVLFGVVHVTQLFQGMALTANLLQILNATIFGMLYGAVRLRVNNIWPLIVIHMLFDVNAALAGVFGPAAVRGFTDMPITFWLIIWIPSVIATIYLVRKPSTAMIDGRPIA